MSTPLEAQPKKESRIEDPPEQVEEDHAANEAVDGLEQLTRAAAAKREEIASLPSREALLDQISESSTVKPTETFKRDGGYAVIVIVLKLRVGESNTCAVMAVWI